MDPFGSRGNLLDSSVPGRGTDAPQFFTPDLRAYCMKNAMRNRCIREYLILSCVQLNKTAILVLYVSDVFARVKKTCASSTKRKAQFEHKQGRKKYCSIVRGLAFRRWLEKNFN